MSCRHILVPICTLASIAGSDAQEQTAVVTRDSSGIQIVDNARPAWDHPQAGKSKKRQP